VAVCNYRNPRRDAFVPPPRALVFSRSKPRSASSKFYWPPATDARPREKHKKGWIVGFVPTSAIGFQ